MPPKDFHYYNRVGTVLATMRNTNMMLCNTAGLTGNFH